VVAALLDFDGGLAVDARAAEEGGQGIAAGAALNQRSM
jgi:isocitrate dehydrogenase